MKRIRYHMPLASAIVLAAVIVYLLHAFEIAFSLNCQIFAGLAMAFLLVALCRVKRFRAMPYRAPVLMLAAALSIRYMIWRTTDTLLYTGFWDMIGLSLLYAAEFYAIMIHLLGIFINIWPEEREPAPMPENEADYPTVDIFIPTYDEPMEIVKITATAALQIDYPKDKFKVYILDDGGTASRRNRADISTAAWERHFALKRMAEQIDVNYITREVNKSAKAGNINHALVHTDGDLVLVLDCDHVPTRDILKNTAGWFVRDEKLFLVQTPHFFINPTPVEKNLPDANVPFESDMFFRRIHPGLDSWNASYFCGSAALLRRTYLMEAGGVAGTSITEDAETSILLHGRGYRSVYINRPMVCGLSPETFDGYIIQRTRWAQGMLQIFVMKNPLYFGKLNFMQRVSYFNSCVFWFFGLSRFIFYLAPALFLILGLKVYHATLPQIIAYVIPHLVSSYTIMAFLYGGTRLPLFSEIYESVQAIFLMPAVFSVLMNPRRPTFKITPKGKRTDARYLNGMATSFLIVVIVNLAAMPQVAVKWIQEPLYRDVIILAASWCMFNIFMSIVSMGAFWENRQVRRFHRIFASGSVVIDKGGRNELTGELKDISLTGLGIELDASAPVSLRESVTLRASDGYGERYELPAKLFRVIKKGGKVLCGYEFENFEGNYGMIVRFVYGDSNRWVDTWDARANAGGTFMKLVYFFGTGLRATKESMMALVFETAARAKFIINRVWMRQGTAKEASA